MSRKHIWINRNGKTVCLYCKTDKGKLIDLLCRQHPQMRYYACGTENILEKMLEKIMPCLDENEKSIHDIIV